VPSRSVWTLDAAVLIAVTLLQAASAAGQQPPAAAALPDATPADGPKLCAQAVPAPSQLPPTGSGPVVYFMGICFSAQGNVSAVAPETYLHYVHLRPSRPSQSDWVLFDDTARDTILDDFKRLWATNFLDDLRVEDTDYLFPNGVIGKLITYHLEERPKVKIVTYEGAKAIDRSKLEEALREQRSEIRADSFLDLRAIATVKAMLRDMLLAKGFGSPLVGHRLVPQAGAKVVNLTFTVEEGPKTTIRDLQFIGNKAFDDDTLARVTKENRPKTLMSLITGGGEYRDQQFAEDAQHIEDFYRDRGYITARVERPELRALEHSRDGRTQWVQLRIPVAEGKRYRLGSLTLDGNQIVDDKALRPLFKLKEGGWYSQKVIRDGLDKAREIYGAGGYVEFTGYPDLKPRNADSADAPAIVDLTVRITEGQRYLVNRITFTGNTTTRDEVIRREMRLVEGGVFSTQALEQSVRRLNQLGYFKPLESGKDVTFEKATTREHAMDLSLKVEEQNRNQLQFGAGMSQYEGVFGNISFTTSNFMGRGESLTLAAQKGGRSAYYQVMFTEPYLFNRPMNGGADLYSRKNDFLTGTGEVAYSEARNGLSVSAGHQLFNFGRVGISYGYEIIETAISDTLEDSLDPSSGVGVPVFNPYLDEGRFDESRITPSFFYNTVDHPFMPRRGYRLSLNLPIAGWWLGGTTNYTRPEAEAVLYIPYRRRMALGLRASGGWLRPFGPTRQLPYYLRYFLGGEYQIRGVDIRTVGPTDQNNRAIGGDRFLLFNAEYYFDLFGPVRAVLFHDAGQAFAEDQPVDLRQLRTSSGVEIRAFLPVLNVPFRLIYAWNIYRDSFQPARALKFAVGTTF